MITGVNNSEILTTKEPAVVLEQILTGQVENKNQTEADRTKIMGNHSPYIKINGYEMSEVEIISFKIDCTSFIPTMILVFEDNTKQFQNDFPKDGDLVELYIRSRNNNEKKKIRVNFDILNINATTSRGSNIYKIKGIMKIPDIFSEKQISLPSDTSFNHLMEICDLTQLGFASNDTNTNDKMPRFNPNNTVKDFILKTLETIYKDDNSFYTAYIDIYYYLCLVNVNNLFSLDEELEDGAADLISDLTMDKSNIEEGETTPNSKLILSNHSNLEATSNYIIEYKLFNNSGDIWMKNGYKRYSQYMDMDSYEFKSFFVDPLTTDGSEEEFVLLKGKSGDNSYLNQNKFAYLGRQFSTNNEGNLHPNYNYAKILNYQNNEELNKLGLTVTLQGISSSIYRYKRIPVSIFEQDGNLTNNISMKNGDSERDTQPSENDKQYERPENPIPNHFLSGFYIVKDYSIEWVKKTGFRQIVNLVRREWPLPYSAGIVKNKK